jgi:hypothetical protein
VPSVAVHADAFARLVESVLRVNGMPRARRAFVPTPVMGKSAEELRAYIEGDDPTLARPFMAQVLESLTSAIPDEHLGGEEFDRSSPRVVEGASEADLHRLFRQGGWTDQLPIVLPTEERVAEMLAATSHSPDESVGKLRPTNYREEWGFTVEKVAVNAVMAGASPAYFPVILALASTQMSARISSTSSMSSMVVVNGPVRNEIGMNAGLGALGPYNHANATIGRAYGLLSQNLQGGSVPGESYMGSQGNNYSYTNLTFPENEEQSPWTPYHVRHGFDPEESTVTSFVCWGSIWTEGLREHWEDKVASMLTSYDPFLGTILVLDPIAAREFHALGFDSPERLTDWIHENVRMPAFRYWNHYAAQTFIREDALNGIEPFATYLRAEPDELIPVFQKDRIEIVVVGGSSNAQWSAFQGATLEPRYRQDGARPMASVDAWR